MRAYEVMETRPYFRDRAMRMGLQELLAMLFHSEHWAQKETENASVLGPEEFCQCENFE